MREDKLVSFRIQPAVISAAMANPYTDEPEVCMMRMSCIMCLFPESRQIRTIEHGWTIQVFEEDWKKVETSFREQFF
jgi:hypothetical protein